MLRKYLPYIGGGLLLVIVVLLFSGDDDTPEVGPDQVNNTSAESEASGVTADSDSPAEPDQTSAQTAVDETTNDEDTAVESASDQASAGDSTAGNDATGAEAESEISAASETADAAATEPADATADVAESTEAGSADTAAGVAESADTEATTATQADTADAESVITEPLDPQVAATAAGVDSWCTESCQRIRVERGITGPTELPPSQEPPAPTPVVTEEPASLEAEAPAPAEVDYDRWCGETCQNIRAARTGTTTAVDETTAETMDPDVAAMAAGVDAWCTESCQRIRIARGISGPTELPISDELPAPAPADSSANAVAVTESPAEDDSAEVDYDKWCGQTCQQIRTRNAGKAASGASDEVTSSSESAAAVDTIDAVSTDKASDFSLAYSSRELGRTVSETVLSLQNVVDGSSANAALPTLNASAERLDTLVSNFESAPQRAKNALKTVSRKYHFQLQATANSVLARNGVDAIIAEPMARIIQSVQTLAR